MVRLFPFLSETGGRPRSMVFVDGENLAIRYGNMVQQQTRPKHVVYEPNIFVWSTGLNNICLYGSVFRKYYYTSVQGDDALIAQIEDKLKSAGIEQPKVFKKTKGRGSKRVDISLATDMLTNAAQKNYEVAVLVAGDEDYVPLVEGVKQQGCRVHLWFLKDGLSPALRRVADYYADIGDVLFSPEVEGTWR
jgi:uncharacterized LabA/DUF88 family protein